MRTDGDTIESDLDHHARKEWEHAKRVLRRRLARRSRAMLALQLRRLLRWFLTYSGREAD